MNRAEKLKTWMQAVAAVVLLSVVAACGGGSGNDNNSGSSGSGNGMNGGTLPASPTQVPITANNTNAVPISVAQGANSVINIPTVSVTVCQPGTNTNCQTINNIQVDTGSFGLRLVGSVLNSSLLSTMTNVQTSGGSNIAECATFADGYTWGSVRNATVQIGTEVTTVPVPVQIIGDLTTSAPRGCGSGSPENTVSDLGANGILGIGTAPYDCGTTCATANTAATYSNYYTCAGTSCTRTAVPLTSQVTNPVVRFPVDNNGVIVQMPAVSNTGAVSAAGTLVFGVGTQSNNQFAGTQKFTTDGYGDLNNSTFNGTTVQAYLDSGSNAYFFSDSTLTQCGSNYPGFYCPSSAQTRTVILSGQDSNIKTGANIGIMSASTLFSSGNNYAFNDLAGYISGSSSFDLGLPFFYGRYVYYGIDQSLIGGNQTPYVGF